MRLLVLLALLGFVSAASELLGATASTCFCTTVPCPVVGSNSLTVGGGSVGTYSYVNHNSVPVVSSVKVTINKGDLDHGSETTTCTQNYSRSLDDDGTQDCDAGHILAHRLGGPGNQPINIFPQSAHINRGTYDQFENSIYQCFATSGATSASLSWSFAYASSSRTKPDNVTYSAKFTGGTCASVTSTFTNIGN